MFPHIDFNVFGAVFSALTKAAAPIRQAYLYIRGPNASVKGLQGTYCGVVASYKNPLEPYITDMVCLKAHSTGTIEGKSIFNHYGENKYQMQLYQSKSNDHIWHGFWKHDTDLRYFGCCLFEETGKSPKKVLNGKYIGPTKDGRAEGANWVLTQTNENVFDYFNAIKTIRRIARRRRASLIESYNTKKGDLVDVEIRPHILDSIIEQHAAFDTPKRRLAEPFEIEDLSFEIPEGGFNPRFGKISRPLVETLVKNEDCNRKRILDVGTGCGFYAVYIGKRAQNSQITGIDSCDKSLISAQKNVERNISVIDVNKNRIEFVRSLSQEETPRIFRGLAIDKRFDLIIANFPFTAKESARKHIESPFYRNFVGSEDLLFELIMGIKLHLAPDGVAYLSYGESGYAWTLWRFLEHSGLKYQVIATIAQRDDTFYIIRVVR